MKTEPIETPLNNFSNGPLTRDIGDLVRYVQATKGLGARAAARYVGRHLNETTLANYRLARQLGYRSSWFPLGFRQASKKGYHQPARKATA